MNTRRSAQTLSTPSPPRPGTFVSPGPRRFHSTITTSIGPLLLISDGTSLVELQLPSFAPFDGFTDGSSRDDALLKPVAMEIEAYLAGELRAFSTPLAPSGTSFQLAVWSTLCDIAYGTTASYGDVAFAIGRPKAPRAVGMANHVNPIALIIPCHRVIGANGSLTGYGGGLPLKSLLLDLEADVVKRDLT